MKKNIFSLNIETLILVAIWNHPFVFQGSFKITNTHDDTHQLLFFRCESELNDKNDILEMEYSPFDYQFTHLYSEKSAIPLTKMDDNLENALYILKYSLKETLQKLITHPKNYFTQIDEIAMSSMTRQIKQYLICRGQEKMNSEEIGFAISISFTPTESVSNMAAETLIGL